MKADYILKANLLDIIFEKKNKEYGAYNLRKFYHQRLYKALALTFISTVILSLFSYLYKDEIVLNIPVIPDISGTSLYQIQGEAPQLPKHTQQLQKNAINSASNKESTPVVYDEITPVEPLNNSEDAGTFGLVDEGTSKTPGDLSPGTSDAKLTSTSVPVVEPVKTIDRSIPVPAEVMPSFPGGIEALRKFLKKNLNTPKELNQEEIVSVTVQFIVGYDGRLKGFRVTEDGGSVFNDEVIRVLKKMPEWIPGLARGEHVSVYYSIPVKFTSTE
ncbi:MAG: energy transducer TonB [Ferruginibacter sp.]